MFFYSRPGPWAAGGPCNKFEFVGDSRGKPEVVNAQVLAEAITVSRRGSKNFRRSGKVPEFAPKGFTKIW